MRESKDLILATKPYAVDQTLRSWWCILSTTFLLIAAIVGTLWHFPLCGKIICSIIAGLLVLRLFVIYHDQQHRAILPNSRLSEPFMWWFVIFALIPSSIWRSSHNHHHNHNSKIKGSHIGSFPIMTKEHYFKSSKGKQLTYLFIRHPLHIFFWYVSMFIFWLFLRPFSSKPRE